MTVEKFRLGIRSGNKKAYLLLPGNEGSAKTLKNMDFKVGIIRFRFLSRETSSEMTTTNCV